MGTANSQESKLSPSAKGILEAILVVSTGRDMILMCPNEAACREVLNLTSKVCTILHVPLLINWSTYEILIQTEGRQKIASLRCKNIKRDEHLLDEKNVLNLS